MQSKNPNSFHPSSFDSQLAGEVEALRQVETSAAAEQRAVFAMQSRPVKAQRRSFFLPIGLGTAAAAIGAGVFLFTGSTRVAAAEILHRLATAQRGRKVRHAITRVSLRNDGRYIKEEFWTDGRKNASKQWSEAGVLEDWDGTNGKRAFFYRVANPELNDPAYATIEGPSVQRVSVGDFSEFEDFERRNTYPMQRASASSSTKVEGDAMIEDGLPASALVDTVEDYKTNKVFKNFKVQHDVEFNGVNCDLYTFDAGASYLLYVDPETGLPLRRDMVAHGRLQSSDLYDYPATIPGTVFEPPKLPGVTFFNYVAIRDQLYNQLKRGGLVKVVAGHKVDLKAVITGSHDLAVLWTVDGKPGRGSAQVVGTKTMHDPEKVIQLSNGRMVTFDGSCPIVVDSISHPHLSNRLQAPFDLVIPVEDLKGRRIGAARYHIGSPIQAPSARELVIQVTSVGTAQSVSVDSASGNLGSSNEAIPVEGQ